MESANVAPRPTPPRRFTVGHLAVPLGAALCLLPWMSTAAGLLAGLFAALAFGNPYASFTRRATHTLLTLAVVGLGAGMDLRVVARVGAHGALYTAAGIAACLLLGFALTRLLDVPRDAGLLIGIGTAICGGSAIAAVVPILKPKEHDVSMALGTVFLLNALALFLFPPLGHRLGLSAAQFGLWSALAIHDTSSVVGAALAYGGQAVEVATTVKLARALWIVPLTLAVAHWRRRARPEDRAAGKPRRPWFILGFVAAAALATFVPALRPAGLLLASASKQVLVVTLFLIGAGLTRDALKAVGPRPFGQGILLWLAMAGGSLLAVVHHLGGVIQ